MCNAHIDAYDDHHDDDDVHDDDCDDHDGDGYVHDDDGSDDDENVEKLVSPSYFGPTCAFVCNQLHCRPTRIIIIIIIIIITILPPAKYQIHHPHIVRLTNIPVARSSKNAERGSFTMWEGEQISRGANALCKSCNGKVEMGFFHY